MSEILVTLVKLIAPVLPFTAEEVWEHMPNALQEAASVHFTTWGDPKPLCEDEEALLARWEQLLRVRKVVAKALERARNEKVIGSSNEAAVDLGVSGDLLAQLERYADSLAGIFIVSEVRLHAQGSEPAAGVREVEGDLAVTVSRAAGEKCERCWRHAEGVGAHPEHPSLCSRCYEVVK